MGKEKGWQHLYIVFKNIFSHFSEGGQGALGNDLVAQNRIYAPVMAENVARG